MGTTSPSLNTVLGAAIATSSNEHAKCQLQYPNMSNPTCTILVLRYSDTLQAEFQLSTFTPMIPGSSAQIFLGS